MSVLNIIAAFMDPSAIQDPGGSKLINVRPVKRQAAEGRPSQVRLIGTPGMSLVCKPVPSAVRALGHALGTYWSMHANGNIFSGVETGTPTFRGTLGATAVARFAEDITGLCIATDTFIGAVANLSGVINYSPAGWIAPSTEDGGSGTAAQFSPSTVCELDNSTVWGAIQGSGAQRLQMFRSLQLAPAQVDALWFASKEARADPLLDLVTLERTYWAFGEASIEQFYDTGAAVDFQYSPFPNSMLEVGLAVRATLAWCQSTVFWVATDLRVWSGTGQTGQPISVDWVSLLISQTSPTSLSAYAYAIGGDVFYVLTSNNSWTIECAISTGLWYYRQSPGRNDHVARCATQIKNGGLPLIGCLDGSICQPNIDLNSEPLGTINRTIISQMIGGEETKDTIDFIDITSPMGPSAGTFQLDWSTDYGANWRGVRQLTWPAPGQRRAVARKLGSERRRQLRLQYSGSQAPFGVDDFYVKVTPGV